MCSRTPGSRGRPRCRRMSGSAARTFNSRVSASNPPTWRHVRPSFFVQAICFTYRLQQLLLQHRRILVPNGRLSTYQIGILPRIFREQYMRLRHFVCCSEWQADRGTEAKEVRGFPSVPKNLQDRRWKTWWGQIMRHTICITKCVPVLVFIICCIQVCMSYCMFCWYHHSWSALSRTSLECKTRHCLKSSTRASTLMNGYDSF